MPPFMLSSRPIKGSIDEETENKKPEEWFTSSPTSVDLVHPNYTNKDIPFKHISWPVHCKKLEHSFSDVSQIIDTSLITKQTRVQPKSLRADFVHLHGVGLNAKKATFNQHHEEKEGFQFRSIQRSMSSLESARPSNEGNAAGTKTIVIVPSMDLDGNELNRMCDCIEYYEERQLYHIMLVSDPSVRIIYITSNHVEEQVVGYYLRLCAGSEGFAGVQDKLARVFVISVPTDKYIPLSDKILEDSNLVELIKSLIYQIKNPSPTDYAGLCVFTGSESADILSQKLGIRVLECSGDRLHYGTKQGSREIFDACGISHPAGTPSVGDDDLRTYGDRYHYDDDDDAVIDRHRRNYWANNHRYIRSSHSLAMGISRQIIIHGVRPRKWILKLNQGFSGKGNASIDLAQFQDCHYTPSQDVEKDVLHMATQIEKEFEKMLKFEDPAMTWNGDKKHTGFQKQIERLGVIAETFIEGEVPSSPSIQAVIEPNDENVGGRVSIVSTHEQILHGQVYHGCINPASQQYRNEIMDIGLKVGQYMAARGVVGHFSCDFLATQKSNGQHELNAVEINLRQGGTTHPQAVMALLCGGCISNDGIFRTNENEVRTYVATDSYSLNKPCSESHLVDAIESKTDPLARKIHWNKEEGVGVVFHLFKFANKGRIGFTAIGRDNNESESLFKATEDFLSHMN